MKKLTGTEALKGGRLELWYQPKINARSLLMHGVEALVRTSRPDWEFRSSGFTGASDKRVSEFAIDQAIEDWRQLDTERGQIEIAINLPIEFVRAHDAINHLCRRLPLDSASFPGLLIEIDGSEIVANLRLAKNIASRLRFSKVAISVDHVGAEWPSLSGLQDFPFVEIKVDRSLINGCADDPSKSSTCHQILELANQYGTRTVAEGIETWADFLTVREIGFDLVQGSLFAEPMTLKKLKQACWSGRGHAYDARHYRRTLDLPANLYEFAEKEDR
jgi:EAL domain-containing protein (putative c-di-GMP-specific phosphodiesterase class I)